MYTSTFTILLTLRNCILVFFPFGGIILKSSSFWWMPHSLFGFIVLSNACAWIELNWTHFHLFLKHTLLVFGTRKPNLINLHLLPTTFNDSDNLIFTALLFQFPLLQPNCMSSTSPKSIPFSKWAKRIPFRIQAFAHINLFKTWMCANEVLLSVCLQNSSNMVGQVLFLSLYRIFPSIEGCWKKRTIRIWMKETCCRTRELNCTIIVTSCVCWNMLCSVSARMCLWLCVCRKAQTWKALWFIASITCMIYLFAYTEKESVLQSDLISFYLINWQNVCKSLFNFFGFCFLFICCCWCWIVFGCFFPRPVFVDDKKLRPLTIVD